MLTDSQSGVSSHGPSFRVKMIDYFKEVSYGSDN
jgi:hypothetical protein